MAKQRKIETILLSNGLVSEEQLKQISSYAHAVGIDLYEAVLQKKIASPDAVMMAYAESVGLPFVHVDDLAFDEGVVTQIDPMTARQYSFVPVSVDHGHVLLITTKPIVSDAADELRMIFNMPIRCAICTPTELSAAITKYYPRDAVRTVKTEPGKIPPEAKKPPVKKKPESVEPMNDEEKKDRLMKTIVACNFTIAFVFFALFFLPLPWGIGNQHVLILLFSIVVAGIAARITWKKLSR